MNMSKISKPDIVKLFENLLWVHSPNDWILKSTYFQSTLFISMLIPVPTKIKYKKIRRSYDIKTIRDRTNDIYGLANDCVDEMKNESKKDGIK